MNRKIENKILTEEGFKDYENIMNKYYVFGERRRYNYLKEKWNK